MILLIASPSNTVTNSFLAVSDLSGIIEAAAAVINLAFIMFFFFKERKETRGRERTRIREERHVNWYKLLVLERLLAELDEYFEYIVQLLIQVKQNEETINIGVASEKIEAVKKKVFTKKRILLPTLGLFDDELKKEVWRIFQEN